MQTDQEGLPRTKLYLQIFVTMNLWSGFWLLPPYQYQILTGTPLRCPVFALGHRDPTALSLQDQPLHELQEFIDGVLVEVGQLKALDLGLGSRSFSAYQFCSHTTRMS